MKLTSNRNIIVAGTQGAWINHIARVLEARGWKILWPEQDIDIRDGERYFNHNKQNIEVQNIHLSLCQQCGLSSLLELNLPRFYEIPYPGPKEFVAKFEDPVVISGTCLSSFLDIWVGTADVVIDIRATEREDLETIRKWTSNSFSEEHLSEIRQVHLERYDEHLKLFPRVFTMSNSEVKDNRFDGLTRFLNSIF